MSKVNDLLIERNEKLKVNGLLKVLGFMKEVHLGIENTAAIKTHRTPTSIRAYCLIFIYIYPSQYVNMYLLIHIHMILSLRQAVRRDWRR